MLQQRLVAALLFALLVPLQFEIHIAAPVNRSQPLGNLPRFVLTAACERRRQRTFVAARQANQSAGKLFQILNRRRAFGLRRLAHLEARNQLAKILIAGLRRAQQHHARRLVGKLVRQPARRSQPIAEATKPQSPRRCAPSPGTVAPPYESAPRRTRRSGRPARSPASPAPPRAESAFRQRCRQQES